ncbi:hypothetical protein B0H10DRAFT_2232309 [Mycena sp. CBHHK59/15]|nr:hypothetical protein B0H10DRAFT_2232309 [Mycena sp. CBHHK59/15]
MDVEPSTSSLRYADYQHFCTTFSTRFTNSTVHHAPPTRSAPPPLDFPAHPTLAPRAPWPLLDVAVPVAISAPTPCPDAACPGMMRTAHCPQCPTRRPPALVCASHVRCTLCQDVPQRGEQHGSTRETVCGPHTRSPPAMQAAVAYVPLPQLHAWRVHSRYSAYSASTALRISSPRGGDNRVVMRRCCTCSVGMNSCPTPHVPADSMSASVHRSCAHVVE